ncbi:hypothetical protein BO78DRAFT_412757 [Aspergillus sclerotiicarbonarius CBS 121057]|uniref:Uncharacterized protein n=1 Tax=Aspergillus sclerotiicarbonarius (strain CBS 121057 / IBT 28362) TaxID=1448318 RepID=A0A319EVU2_ASPSB|nr:hypothetical protein BO78DRAFT_412757 [Aspergillus sclerotiicarbonarius CBS 121057]
MNFYQLTLGSMTPEERISEAKEMQLGDFLAPEFLKNPGLHVVFMPSSSEISSNEDLCQYLTGALCIPSHFLNYEAEYPRGCHGSTRVSPQPGVDGKDGASGYSTYARFVSREMNNDHIGPGSPGSTVHSMGFASLWLKQTDSQKPSKGFWAKLDRRVSDRETHILLCFDLDKHAATQLMGTTRYTNVSDSHNEPSFLLKSGLDYAATQFAKDLKTFTPAIIHVSEHRLYSSVRDKYLTDNYGQAGYNAANLDRVNQHRDDLRGIMYHVIEISEALAVAVESANFILECDNGWKRSLETGSKSPVYISISLETYLKLFSNLKDEAHDNAESLDRRIETITKQQDELKRIINY